MPLAPKLLLLTNGDPNANGIGELFLRDIASYYPPGRLFRFSLVDTPKQIVKGTWLGFHSVTRSVQYSSIPGLSSLRQLIFCRFTSNAIVADIERFIKENDIDIVWAVLNSGYMIYLSKRLMARLSTPFVFTVWDTPEFFAKTRHLDYFTKRFMLQSFAHVLQKGRRVAVASEGMRDEFRKKYDVESIVMIHGIHPAFWYKPALELKSKYECTIGFAGSLYSKREWNAFVKAVRNLDRIEGHKVSIRFIGRFPRFGARKEPFIDLIGRLSFQDTLKALQKTDVAYIPYWFDRKRSYIVKTAFPSKLSAYTAAGIPVFYHGPVDSSPKYFMDKYRIGLCCHSLEIKDIQETLRSLLFECNVRVQAGAEQQRALDEELGLECFLLRFATLLGIDRCILLPLDSTVGV